ncbi:MAG: response regulator transcription factor [Elusimicrobia bacterium]|nr:response regulator transcription factor [Elusimicrobiota bacterium]
MWPFGGGKSQRTVLLVDDDVNTRTMLGMYFQETGWKVSEAANGQEGVEAALASPHDLIVMDIDMPLMTGSEALVILRANPKTQKTPIVMVTARGTLDDVDGCLSKGANDYLTKPFEFARLKAKVDRLVPPQA